MFVGLFFAPRIPRLNESVNSTTTTWEEEKKLLHSVCVHVTQSGVTDLIFFSSLFDPRTFEPMCGGLENKMMVNI